MAVGEKFWETVCSQFDISLESDGNVNKIDSDLMLENYNIFKLFNQTSSSLLPRCLFLDNDPYTLNRLKNSTLAPILNNSQNFI